MSSGAGNRKAMGNLARLQHNSVCLPASFAASVCVFLHLSFLHSSVDVRCGQATMIQKHWRGIEARSRVSAQLEMELVALQAEADEDSTDESADEIVVGGATAERTASDVLFTQLEAEAEAEIAAVRASRMHFSLSHSFHHTKHKCPVAHTGFRSRNHFTMHI